jgi:acyl-CoA thioesterase-1
MNGLGRSLRWLTLCLSAWLAVMACGQSQDPEEPTSSSGLTRAVGVAEEAKSEHTTRSPEPPKIVAFGDSLTAGWGVPPEQAYPAQLQRRLDEAGFHYRVINAGVSGETTAGGLRRVDWVLKSQPHIVILELGANDGLRGLDPTQIRANLEGIITKLEAAGVKTLLAGMKLPPNYGAEYTARFMDIYPDLARKHRLTYMPFFLEGVGAQPRLNQPDGIHPTAVGYRIIVDHLVPVLLPLLERPVNR